MTPFCIAVENGFLNIATILLEQKANIHMKNLNYNLLRACYDGNLDVVKYLIPLNANLESTNENGCTPVIFACQRGHLEIVKILIENKVNL
eukprot:TRINITY_DN6277_c0_g1_i2.p2 TRINITY_DN6277_c0_g1~~TRINITY_DN6277_c0_g1_i2.p2  ORF type:complete len:103 (+),score=26.64 TRINITY_DN6277_c0_g1_i2:37-309(+)